MPDTRSDHEVQVVEVTREEGREMLDRAAREALNISADEFLAKWDAGDYEDADDPAVTRVAMLIPRDWYLTEEPAGKVVWCEIEALSPARRGMGEGTGTTVRSDE